MTGSTGPAGATGATGPMGTFAPTTVTVTADSSNHATINTAVGTVISQPLNGNAVCTVTIYNWQIAADSRVLIDVYPTVPNLYLPGYTLAGKVVGPGQVVVTATQAGGITPPNSTTISIDFLVI